MKATKSCKGLGIAKGHGCNTEVRTETRQKGLCIDCYRGFIFSGTMEGEKEKEKFFIKNSKVVTKEKKSAAKKEKRESDSTAAMSLADTYFSRYIRVFHSIDGQCTCYTCGTIKPIKQVDNGHYIKRAHKSTRYHEMNCRPQCKTCNGDTLHNGKQVEFRINLINEIGLASVEELELLGRQSIKADALFFRDIADEYRIKTNELQLKLGVKYF